MSDYSPEEQIHFMIMTPSEQMAFLKSEFNSVKNTSDSIRGAKAFQMRGLRTLMDLEGLFEIDSDFMDRDLREFLNLKEDGTMNYSIDELINGKNKGWKEQPEIGSKEHQRTAQNGIPNRKFTNKDGREVVLRNIGPDLWEVIIGSQDDMLSFLDQATFNYGSPNPLPHSKHGLYDMTPFFIKNGLPGPDYWGGYLPKVKGL